MTRKNQRERDILEAAVKVFSKKGYHKSKMQNIADEASVGKGTLYEYFNSKSHLFQEMIAYSINYYMENLEDIMSKPKDLVDLLIDIANFHGKFISDHLDLAQNVVNNSVDLSEDIGSKMICARKLFLSKMLGYIKDIKGKGLIKEDVDERLVIMILFGTLNQFYTEKIHVEKQKFEDIDPYPVINLILNGIK